MMEAAGLGVEFIEVLHMLNGTHVINRFQNMLRNKYPITIRRVKCDLTSIFVGCCKKFGKRCNLGCNSRVNWKRWSHACSNLRLYGDELFSIIRFIEEKFQVESGFKKFARSGTGAYIFFSISAPWRKVRLCETIMYVSLDSEEGFLASFEWSNSVFNSCMVTDLESKSTLRYSSCTQMIVKIGYYWLLFKSTGIRL